VDSQHGIKRILCPAETPPTRKQASGKYDWLNVN
jgi:hypothetical protein